MSTSTLDRYSAVAQILSPSAVSQYLASQDWDLAVRQRDVREIWEMKDASGRTQARVMVPLATDYIDFHTRFSETLQSLGLILDQDADQLQELITAIRADLFFVRLDQAMTDATISIKQAEQTIESVYKMLRAAATTAAAPAHSHLGKRPARVTEFLDEDVRLGHTKRGSFVFTVVTRLGDQLPSHEETEAQPFPRQVMETLARGLQTTRNLASGQDSQALAEPASYGLSASLVESLEDMSQPAGLRALDLSFQWAAGATPPAVGREPIVMDRDVMGALPRVRERLVRQEEPPRRERLIGLVKTLSWNDSEEDEAGAVTVVAEVGGRMRTIHVTLTGEDHDWAIAAYRQKVPITLTGDLVRERRAWRLTGDVELDSTFLRHRRDDD